MKLLFVGGARPNFMKLAPMLREVERHEGMSCVLVHTGQHYDESLSDVFFRQLKIRNPDIHLGIGSAPREEQIERIDRELEEHLRHHRPDVIVVVGDVNSTVGAARSGTRLGIKIAHVEAGLRSRDLTMPEELNRIETDRLSNYLFVTEDSGMKNLADEGVPGEAFLVGNVMIDTLAYHLPEIKALRVALPEGVSEDRFAIGTFHRPANVDSREALSELVALWREIGRRIPLVIPLHPRTAGSLERHKISLSTFSDDGVHFLKPLGYLEFLNLVMRSTVVVTDSGGIQEETTYLQVPCLTMRDSTERPVTIEQGTNVLVGRNRESVIGELDAVLNGKGKKGAIPSLWDGKASERIISILAERSLS